MNLGADYLLTDGKLAIKLNELLVVVKDNAREFEADCDTFERSEFGSESNKKEAFDRLVSIWGSKWDEIRIKSVRNCLRFPRITLGGSS